MAKAKAIRELDCTADAREWAKKVLDVRFGEVAAQRDSALDFSDVDGVHDMRVAARRLRSAMRDFRPLADKGQLKKLGKELKQFADALGEVRDQDVAIAALKELRSKARNGRFKKGIEKLSEERRAVRECARRHLTEVLADGEIEKFRERFVIALEKAFTQKGAGRAVSFHEAGRSCVRAGLEDLLDLSTSIYQPSNNDGLHRLRVATKRLRYAIELFVPCWGEAITPFADEMAKMQSFLGEVHDCDVWIQSLGRRLIRGEKNEENDADERAAAPWLLSEFTDKRNTEYRSALGLWTSWENSGFIENMRATVLHSD